MSSAGSTYQPGSLASFLFNGQPPTNTGASASAGPVWLQQALNGVVNAGTQLAGQPYQNFPGQTVATPSANTTAAWNLAASNQGNYQPFLNQAGAFTQQAAAPITQGAISQFMNPYQSAITQGIDTNLQQNILPGIQDKFTSAGQSRSPQEAQVTGQAIYGANQAVGQSLAGAEQGAVSSLLQKQGQLGSLGAQSGQLGALTQQLGAGDVSQLATAGAGQDAVAQANINSAMNQFQNQQQWPYQNLGFLSNIIHGLPVESAGTQTSGLQTVTPTPQNPGLASGLNLATGTGLARGGRVGALSRGRPVYRGREQQFRRAA